MASNPYASHQNGYILPQHLFIPHANTRPLGQGHVPSSVAGQATVGAIQNKPITHDLPPKQVYGIVR